MRPFATFALAGVVAALVTVGIRLLTARFPDRTRSSWSDVGGVGLIAGLVAGFALVDVLANPERWEWGFVVWPGVFIGLFAGMIPSAEGGHRTLGWAFFVVGALGGLVVAALLSVF